MAFRNAKLVLKRASGWNALKLFLLTARASRPGLRFLSAPLLRALTHNGEVPIRYRQANRTLDIALREDDKEGDLHSIIEVVLRQVYVLDPAFAPDLVIDGGANIGLFSLQAAAVYPHAKLIACEPLPRNIAQIKKHCEQNNVDAELMSVCLGGTRRTIPFYCRGANASSFDSLKPYDQVMEIDVLRLNDVVGDSSAQKLLIKLDIEGMEIETLQSYIPGEKRAVIVLGELHGHKENSATLQQLFTAHGWSCTLGDLSGEDTTFEAQSPAAARLTAGDVHTS